MSTNPTIPLTEPTAFLVELKDGSTWTARYDDIMGEIELLTQVHPPSASPPSPSADGDGEAKAEPDSSESMPIGKDYGDAPVEEKPAEKKEPSPLSKEQAAKLSDHVFRARLESVMTDNKYDRRLKGRTKGRLDMSRLYKAPTMATNLFTQKLSRSGKMYNVVLVVDESGSMRTYNRSQVAAECTVFLAKSFEGININVAIVGFNRYVTVRKQFTGKADYDKIFDAIASRNHDRGAQDNNDYDALNRAYHLLDTAPKGKNIVLFLSDGSPETCTEAIYRNERDEPDKFKHHVTSDVLDHYEKDQQEHLHHLVKSNDHRATSIGIGIQQGGWQVPNNFVVQSLEDLKPTLINVFRTHITRG